MKKSIITLIILSLLFFISQRIFASNDNFPASSTREVKEKSAVVQPEVKIGGGVRTFSETVLAEHTYTDFFSWASLFFRGTVVKDKMGYFFHAKADYYPMKDKINPFQPVKMFMWLKPVRFLTLKVGRLKEPGEISYLTCWIVRLFARPPQIKKLLNNDKMAIPDAAVMVAANYKKFLGLDFYAFRTNTAEFSKKFNLLYFMGGKVSGKIARTKVNLRAYYGFEPHDSYVPEITNTSFYYSAQRKILSLALSAKGYGATFFGEYIRYGKDTQFGNINSIGVDLETSYRIKFASFVLRPKVRYDVFDANANVTGDRKTSIVLGVDMILSANPAVRLNYRVGVEYQINKEESNESKNDVLRLVFQVGNF